MTTSSQPSAQPRIHLMVAMPDNYTGTPEQAQAEVRFLLQQQGLAARVQHSGLFGPAVEPMAVISTAHVRPETMARLGDPEALPFEGLVGTATPGEGVFLVVPRDRAELALYAPGWPADLRDLMTEAHAAGLQWLKLDGAAQVLRDLPQYPWESDAAKQEARLLDRERQAGAVKSAGSRPREI